MAGLQRSVVSFRRQGSSGLVWDDKLSQIVNQKEDSDKVQSENKEEAAEVAKSPTPPAGLTIERNRSNGGGRGFRTGKVSPAIEPPSPKISACGFCSAFGGRDKNRRRPPPKSGKRVN